VSDERVIELQLIHIIVRRIRWCWGKSQEHFVHNVAGGLVIYKQRNHGEHGLNFSANPREILLFLSQNAMGSFMVPSET
jgi:hypothetical protein